MVKRTIEKQKQIDNFFEEIDGNRERFYRNLEKGITNLCATCGREPHEHCQIACRQLNELVEELFPLQCS